jgi:cell division protein FtsB
MMGVTRLKEQGKDKKIKPNRRSKLLGNFLFAVGLIVIIGASVKPMYAGMREKIELEQQIASLAQEASDAAKYNSELKDRIKYSDDDEYIEKMAREKLNMVKSDEIIYVDRNKE